MGKIKGVDVMRASMNNLSGTVTHKQLTFAQFLKEERTKRHLSQRQLAEEMNKVAIARGWVKAPNFSHVTISRYESEKSVNPEMLQLRLFAVIFDTPLPLIIAIAYPDVAGEISMVSPEAMVLALRLMSYPESVRKRLIAASTAD